MVKKFENINYLLGSTQYTNVTDRRRTPHDSSRASKTFHPLIYGMETCRQLRSFAGDAAVPADTKKTTIFTTQDYACHITSS